MLQKALLTLLALAGPGAAHGLIASPPMRAPGAATVAACGQSVVDEVRRDNTSHVEGLPELARQDAGFHAESCNLWLCRGVQFADNAAVPGNVQAWRPGQVVPVRVRLTIPHSGSANVSIVDAASNAVVGRPLLTWPSGYADERAFYAGTTPANQTSFNITVPEDLGSRCAEPGACVLQWWWYGTAARQTYEACVDFTVAAPAMEKRLKQ